MADHDEEVRDLRDEVARLRSALEAEQRHAAQWRQVAEERRVALERLRHHPSVRVVMWAADRLLPPARRARQRGSAGSRHVKRVTRGIRALPARAASPARERALRDAIWALPPAPQPRARLTVIVEGKHGRAAVGEAAQRPGTQIVTATDLSGANTKNAAAAGADGEVLCYLRAGVEPMTADWLARMVAALDQPGVVAVGAQLVWGRSGAFSAGGRPLTVSQRGIAFCPVPGGLPQPVPGGEGRPAVVEARTLEVPAASTDCLVVDRAAFEAVGGFDEAYHCGVEDIDLCWRLRLCGGRVVVAADALLRQHGDAVRRGKDPQAWARRKATNWRRWADRFGPSLARAVARDRLTSTLALADRPFTVAIVGPGPRGAHGSDAVARALQAVGWDVEIVGAAGDAQGTVPEHVDAVLVPRHDCDVRRLRRVGVSHSLAEDPGVVTIAWVSDRDDLWRAQPWFADFDEVVTAGEAEAQRIRAETRRRPIVVGPTVATPDRGVHTVVGTNAAELAWSSRACGERLRELLLERVERPSFLLRTSVPDRKVAPQWGDLHFAEALARELSSRGHPVRVEVRAEWHEPAGRAYDIMLHLKGRSRAPCGESQLCVVWSISHPEELTIEEVDQADLVFVAGEPFAEELRRRTDTPVEVMLQATDHRRFRPQQAVMRHAHDVAFVGNSRFVLRPVVRDALAVGVRPAVYGANWEKFLDPDLVVAAHVLNERLPALYSSVRILLNDHWEGMRTYGYVSNRIFDALACGACVISDAVPGLEELFDDAVAVYHTPDELRELVDGLLEDEGARRARGEAGRAAVLRAHTFAHRADQLIAATAPRAELKRRGTTALPTSGG